MNLKILNSSENHKTSRLVLFAVVNLNSKKIKRSWWKWKPCDDQKKERKCFIHGIFFRENVVCASLFRAPYIAAVKKGGYILRFQKLIYQLFKNLYQKDYHKYIIKCTHRKQKHLINIRFSFKNVCTYYNFWQLTFSLLSILWWWWYSYFFNIMEFF